MEIEIVVCQVKVQKPVWTLRECIISGIGIGNAADESSKKFAEFVGCDEFPRKMGVVAVPAENKNLDPGGERISAPDRITGAAERPIQANVAHGSDHRVTKTVERPTANRRKPAKSTHSSLFFPELSR